MITESITTTEEAKTTAARSIADIPTDKASRYLQQLAKHFAHKLPVTFDPQAGEIVFAIGTCRMTANDTRLTLTLIAPDAAQMPQLQDVVVRHLVRFAVREEIAMEWRAA
ncbi:MAG TPA: DUF2218 domain-containing protein [Sphingobium sp.]